MHQPPQFPPSKRITAAEARALVASGRFIRYPEMAHKLMGAVYESSDGRVLIMLGGRWARLVESKEALLAYRAAAEARMREGPRSWAADFPQGRRFAEELPALLASLPALIRAKAERLDYSVKSVAAVDTAIRKMKRDVLLGPDIMPALVAYVGEVVRRAVGGQWAMRPAGEAWEPWVVDANGRLFSPLVIGKEILEYLPRQFLRVHVEAALREGSRSWVDPVERERGERALAVVRRESNDHHEHAQALSAFVQAPLDNDGIERIRAELTSAERQIRAGALERLVYLSFPPTFGRVRGTPVVAKSVDARVEALEAQALQLLNDSDPSIRGLAIRGLVMQDVRRQLLQHPPEEHDRLLRQDEIPLSADASRLLIDVFAREQVNHLRRELLHALTRGAMPATARVELILMALADEWAEARHIAQQGILRLEGKNEVLRALVAKLQTQSEPAKLCALAAFKVLRRRSSLRRTFEAWVSEEQQPAVLDALAGVLAPSGKRATSRTT